MHLAKLLAGDIGGTKTVLALFEDQEGDLPIKPILEKRYASTQFDTLNEIVSAFIAEANCEIDAASFGVAGPVVDGRAQITNLPWLVDTRLLKQTLGIDQVTLLNDLEAIANAVPYLSPDDRITLSPGQADATGTIGIVAPGTGLGEAFLVWNGKRYESYPSEGGHASFGPTSALQRELLMFLSQTYDHVSYERVCSGSGIPNLYTFLKEINRYAEPEWLQDQLATATDKTPIIVNCATEKKAEICVATLDLFIEILAGEAANMALNLLATGGMYLGGGIPPRIIKQLQQSKFNQLFSQKGRFADLLSKIPVYIICNPKVALYGAAYQGLHGAHSSGHD